MGLNDFAVKCHDKNLWRRLIFFVRQNLFA